MRVVLILAVISLSLFAEPSAYKAGDLDLDNPYGLTESEKRILENRTKVKKLNRSYATVKQRAEDNSVAIQGLQSIIESQNATIAKLRKRLMILENKLGVNPDSSFTFIQTQPKEENNISDTPKLINEPELAKKGSSLIERIENLEKYVKESRDINNKNTKKIMSSIRRLAKKSDRIFMTKKEANKKFKSIIKFLKTKLSK